MTTAVVIPTYNEAKNVPVLFERLVATGLELRVIVVDDGSPDGTGDLALAEGARLGLVVDVLRRSGKLGLGSAYVFGFGHALEAGVERVVQMDADLSHDPADVPRILDPTADLVIGSRYSPGGGVRNWPAHRRLLSRFGSVYARAWLGLGLRDLTGGFKAWRATTLRRVLERPLTSEGYVFQVETTWRAVQLGASIAEVPIVFTERVEGVSKMSSGIAWEAARRVPLLRFGSAGAPTGRRD